MNLSALIMITARRGEEYNAETYRLVLDLSRVESFEEQGTATRVVMHSGRVHLLDIRSADFHRLVADQLRPLSGEEA